MCVWNHCRGCDEEYYCYSVLSYGGTSISLDVASVILWAIMSLKVFVASIVVLEGVHSTFSRCSSEDVSFQLVTGRVYQNQKHILETKVSFMSNYNLYLVSNLSVFKVWLFQNFPTLREGVTNETISQRSIGTNTLSWNSIITLFAGWTFWHLNSVQNLHKCQLGEALTAFILNRINSGHHDESRK